MMFSSCHVSRHVLAFSALLLLMPMSARAQVTSQTALNQPQPSQTSPSPAAAPQTTPTGAAQSEPSPEQTNPPRTLTATAVDKMKQVAKSASDIFSRVPC